jgi:N,N-dimethylformamidase beta subunit-like, C-terminal
VTDEERVGSPGEDRHVERDHLTRAEIRRAQHERQTMARRAFLRRAGAVTGVAALAGIGAVAAENWSRGSSPRPKVAHPRSAVRATPTKELLPDGMELPTAGWVISENSRPGTLNWLVGGHQQPGAIEGFADRTSTAVGETVTLYVSTRAATFHVEAYRLGWYQGLGGRLVWASPEVTGAVQPPSVVIPGTRTVECHWQPSTSFPVTSAWPPGMYVLKLVGSGGEQQFVPMALRDDASRAAYVIQNSVTTWQAYNLWGSYSLYYGPEGRGQSYANRSRVVSFDRPYPLDWANGAADLLGNELPLIMLVEKHGLDVTYWTDLDLDRRSSLLPRHKALLSLGHDEYWSPSMRAGATSARDIGVNLVFFGANACFRRIRFEDSPVGPGRHQVCYKDPHEDPLYGVNDAIVTANWPDAPAANPQSSLIGSLYISNPVNADLIVADATSWLYAGTGAVNGDAVQGLVGSEFDAYDPTGPSPANAQILAHSPVVAHGVSSHSDVTWYTAPSGAGVLATGTNWWISKLSDAPLLPAKLLPGPFPSSVTSSVTQMTLNVLSAVGWGPAGQTYPAVSNWRTFYSPSTSQGNGPLGDHAA